MKTKEMKRTRKNLPKKGKTRKGNPNSAIKSQFATFSHV
jgi:hypothetical protein